MLFERKPPLLNPETRSFELTHQPHAVWLSSAKHAVNKQVLNDTLALALQQHATPEVVLYTIPNRDMGQASAGGTETGKLYLAQNQELAFILKAFIHKANVHPVVYLEPDALPQLLPAVEGCKTPDAYPAWVKERLWLLKQSIMLFQQVGCYVFVDVGHSGWVSSVTQQALLCSLLQEVGVNKAKGLVSNISNFQPISPSPQMGHTGEITYLKTLFTLLRRHQPALVLQFCVDAGRSVPSTQLQQLHPRKFVLKPAGTLWEVSTPTLTRCIGTWEGNTPEFSVLKPTYGTEKPMLQLLKTEQYQWQANQLIAPVWLDPVLPNGKTPVGALLPSKKIDGVDIRWIKPPDEADGCLPYKPGNSVSLMDAQYLGV
jgi:hypothetical protein